MWRAILGVVTLTALLAGTALLGACALLWLRPDQHTPAPDQDSLSSNATSLPKDLNALVRIVGGSFRVSVRVTAAQTLF